MPKRYGPYRMSSVGHDYLCIIPEGVKRSVSITRVMRVTQEDDASDRLLIERVEPEPACHAPANKPRNNKVIKS